MASTYLGASAVATGRTSVALGAFTMNTGEAILIFVTTKPDTGTINTPAGWTPLSNVAGGGGTVGNGVGPTRGAWFFREKDATWSALPTISITSGNSSAAQAYRFSKSGTTIWDTAAATGVYGTSATVTNCTATMGSSPDIASGDMLVAGLTSMDEGPTWSGQSVTATGATIGAATEMSEAIETTTGNDVGGMTFNAPVTAGSSSAAPVVNATASIATRGTSSLIRLREVAPPTAISGSESIALSVSEVAARDIYINASETIGLKINEGMDLSKGINNRAANPSFETQLGTTATSNATITRVQDATAWDGQYVAVASIAASGGSGTLATTEATPILPNTQYTVGMRYRLRSGTPAGTQRLAVRQYNSAGVQVHSANFSLVNGEPDETWLEVSGTFTSEADASYVRVGYVSTLGAVSEIDMDGIQVNLGPTLLDYDPLTITEKSASDTIALSIGDGQATLLAVNFDSNTDNHVSWFDATVVRTTADTYSGAGALHWTAQAAFSGVNLSNWPYYAGVTPGQALNFSVATKGLSGAYDTSVDWAISFYNESGTQQGSTTNVSLAIGSTWAVGTSNTITVPAGATRVGWDFSTNNAGVGSVILLDAIRVTSGSGTPASVEVVGGSEPKSGSESTSLSVSESTAVSVSLSRTDTGSIAVSETTASDLTNTTFDTVAISVSDTSALMRGLPGSDSASLAVSETSSLFKSITVTDTASIAVNDVSSVLTDNNIPGADSAALTVTDTSSVEVFVSRSDSAVIAASDASATTVTLSASDAAGIALADNSSLTSVNDVSVSDTASVGVSESVAVDASLSRDDTVSIGLTETTSLFKEMVASDDAALTVTEQAGNDVTQAADDSVALSVDESTHQLKTFGSDDTVSLSIDEDVSLFKDVSATDSVSLTITEVSGLDSNLPGTENVSLGVAEQASIFADTVTSDSIELSLDEQGAVGVALSVTDEAVIVLEDTGSLFTEKFASDAGSISVAEVASDSVIGAEETTDTLSVGMTEEVALLVPVTASDNAAVSVIESRDITVSSTASDTISVGLTENTSVLASLEDDDTLSIALSETANNSETNYHVVSDTAGLAVEESASVTVALSSQDDAAITLYESVTQFGSRPGGDILYIGLTETVHINVFTSASDTMALSVDEDSYTTEEISSSDIASLSVSESSFKQEPDMVQALVYQNGEWVHGTAVQFKNGRWRTIDLYAFKNGQWVKA